MNGENSKDLQNLLQFEVLIFIKNFFYKQNKNLNH